MEAESRAADTAPRLRLRISPAAETALRAGHPWVFADSIRRQNRPGRSGELAVVYDRKDRFLAVGLFDPDSPIRLRVLQAGQPAIIDRAWWSGQLDHAIARRRGLLGEQTTGYRLVNGESDGWPGLVLDRYDRTLVLKLYTAAWLPRLREIAELVLEQLRPQRLVLRLSRNVPRAVALGEPAPRPGGATRPPGQQVSRREYDGSARAAGEPAIVTVADGQVLQGPAPEEPVIFLESGLQFEADVVRGQKTGFFLDQRENRRGVEWLAAGRKVLNAFSYSGGFSLYAARGGARTVTDLDLSSHALAGARRNFALNETTPAIARCPHELVEAEAFEWLAASPRRRFDLVVLDPPSLARREAERLKAVRAYERLARLGIARLAPRGILVACSCSAHVTAEEFFGAVRAGATKSERRFAEARTTGHPPDHPFGFREAQYLKAIWLRFD